MGTAWKGEVQVEQCSTTAPLLHTCPSVVLDDVVLPTSLSSLSSLRPYEVTPSPPLVTYSILLLRRYITFTPCSSGACALVQGVVQPPDAAKRYRGALWTSMPHAHRMLCGLDASLKIITYLT